MLLLILPFTGSCLVAPLPEDLSRPEEELWLPDWSGLSELSGLSEPSGLSEFSGLSSAGGAALLISNVRDAGAGVLYLDSHVLNSPKSNSALIVWVPTNDSPGFVHLSTAVPSSPTETISASGFSIIIEMNITLQLVLVNSLHAGNDIKILFLCSENFFRKLDSGRPVHSR